MAAFKVRRGAPISSKPATRSRKDDISYPLFYVQCNVSAARGQGQSIIITDYYRANH
jgi:hypothetical protein